MCSRFKSYVSILLFLSFVIPSVAQQNLPILRVSPQASVSQNIASFAKIDINYSCPSVNGREVWGKLVPYGLAPNAFGNGKPMPWRAGANETTTITFSHDVKIEGKDLKAGSYGLHMIPNENDVTIIFNKNTGSWGSFFYEKDLDALRVNVKMIDAEHRENLQYTFDNITPNSATVYLHWGNKKIPFKVEVDRNEVILSTYRQELTTLPGFNQAAWGAAAAYCQLNNVNLDEGMKWIEKALNMGGGANFNNKQVKAGILTLQGRTKEAEELKSAAMESATEVELNAYGYQLMGAGKLDDALKIFKLNVDRFPDSWNVYDSYAEALGNKGNKQEAAKYYEMALKKAPEAQKARIEQAIKNL
ncbi:MAG: DUF2911 domain-containing protein [Calditrichaeota bacterium]|nr:DUF2911 domain-containing protein [Calditrichota bacterium]